MTRGRSPRVHGLLFDAWQQWNRGTRQGKPKVVPVNLCRQLPGLKQRLASCELVADLLAFD